MTIDATPSEIVHKGTGGTGPFAVPFRFLAAADLVVLRRPASGAAATLALGLDYTVDGAGATAGGSVTLAASLPAGASLVVRRQMALAQPVAFVENGALPAAALEGALDRLAMLAQEVGRRAVQAAPGDEALGPPMLPRAAERAGRIAGYDAAGRPACGTTTLTDVDAAIARLAGGGSGNGGGGGVPAPGPGDLDRVLKVVGTTWIWASVEADEIVGLGTAATRGAGPSPGQVPLQDAAGQVRIGNSTGGLGSPRLSVSAVEAGDVGVQVSGQLGKPVFDALISDTDPGSGQYLRFTDLIGTNGWLGAEAGDAVTLEGTNGVSLTTQGGTRRLQVTASGAIAAGGASPAAGYVGAGDLTLPASRAARARNTAKAWVNFNGTGTVTVRDSFNVASITDNGTGDFTLVFANAMADANYATVGTSNAAAGASTVAVHPTSAPTSTGVRIVCLQNGVLADVTYVNVIVMGQ
jgi:hypothetical protein